MWTLTYRAACSSPCVESPARVKPQLALDTLYAEGQRRYIESFSAYTRQFLQRLDKPDYDSIEGLPPALAVARGSAVRGNRSTVGTASETLDYLRLLYSKIAELHCHHCGQRVVAYVPQSVAQLIEAWPADLKIMVGFQTHWEDVADRASVLADLQAQGFVRLLCDGRLLNLGQTEREQLAERLPRQGSVLVIVDRLRGGDSAARTAESIEAAFAASSGEIQLLLDRPVRVAWKRSNRNRPHPTLAADLATADVTLLVDDQAWQVARFSRQRRCPTCDIDYPAPESRLFSFNSPLGACPRCEGFGDTIDMDMQLIVPDPRKTIREGAIAPWCTPAYSYNLDELLDIADDLKLPVDVPFSQLSDCADCLAPRWRYRAGLSWAERVLWCAGAQKI